MSALDDAMPKLELLVVSSPSLEESLVLRCDPPSIKTTGLYKMPDRPPDLFHIHQRVYTGAFGPLIEDTVHRNGKAIGDAARKVPGTGYRYNGIRPKVRHVLSRQGPPGRHPTRDAVLFQEGDDLGDLAAAAPPATPHILGNPKVTIIVLETLRQQDHKLFRPYRHPLDLNHSVIDVNEGALHHLLGNTEYPSHHHDKREKVPRQKHANGGKKQGITAKEDDIEKQYNPQPDDDKGSGEKESYEPRDHGMDL